MFLPLAAALKIRCYLILASCLFLVGVVSGCSSVKEELKPVKLKPIEAKYNFERVWSKSAGKGQDARYARLQPGYIENKLYVVDSQGVLSAWGLENGNRVWKTKLNYEVGAGVGVSHGLGFVGTLDGKVVAFDLEDGSVKWESSTSSEVLSIPQSNGQVVIAQAIDGRVFAFDVSDGKQLWTYDHVVPVLSLRSNAKPLVTSNVAFLAFDNGQILSFDLFTGQLRWAARVGQPQGKTELERLVDVDATPLEMGPYIYGAGYNARLVAIAKGTGRIVWGQDASTSHDIFGIDNRIVLTDPNSHIKAYDALTGTPLWQSESLHRRGVSAPVIIGEMVVAVDDAGYLHGLSVQDGSLVARKKISSSPVLSQPLVIDNTLYILDKKGKLSAWVVEEAETKSSFWRSQKNLSTPQVDGVE